jgi:hypothetical protein
MYTIACERMQNDSSMLVPLRVHLIDYKCPAFVYDREIQVKGISFVGVML